MMFIRKISHLMCMFLQLKAFILPMNKPYIMRECRFNRLARYPRTTNRRVRFENKKSTEKQTREHYFFLQEPIQATSRKNKKIFNFYEKRCIFFSINVNNLYKHVCVLYQKPFGGLP